MNQLQQIKNHKMLRVLNCKLSSMKKKISIQNEKSTTLKFSRRKSTKKEKEIIENKIPIKTGIRKGKFNCWLNFLKFNVNK